MRLRSRLRNQQRSITRIYLLFLLLPQSEQRHIRHFDNLERNTTNITLGLSLLTKPSNQNLCPLVPNKKNANFIPSFSSMKFKQPSFGTKLVTLKSIPFTLYQSAYFFPFLMS